MRFHSVGVVWKLKTFERQHAKQHSSGKKIRNLKLLTTKPQFDFLMSIGSFSHLIGCNKNNAFVLFTEERDPPKINQLTTNQTFLHCI